MSTENKLVQIINQEIINQCLSVDTCKECKDFVMDCAVDPTIKMRCLQPSPNLNNCNLLNLQK